MENNEAVKVLSLLTEDSLITILSLNLVVLLIAAIWSFAHLTGKIGD